MNKSGSHRVVIYVMCMAMLMLACREAGNAQGRREDIYSEYALYQKRVALEKDLRERIIGRNMALPLNEDTEDKFMSACWAVSQFLFSGPEVNRGFKTMFSGYDSLSNDSRRALLEAVYAVSPGGYDSSVRVVLEKETDPKIFAMCAAFLYRADTGTDNGNALKIKMAEKFPGYDSLPILVELQDYLSYHNGRMRESMPDIPGLFRWQKGAGRKTIYSFQRWDRDYPGLAIVQLADGSFLRNGDGRLAVFEQLARSGPNLPYFITDGSTPQGIFSIQGSEVSRTNFIGPTPNLQLLMPFEGSWTKYFHLPEGDIKDSTAGVDSLRMYLGLLPEPWRSYAPMMEAWHAGRIGRTEIIAHGTTIDPEYYSGMPFYPLTPTMGCLCAKELWNPTTGRLLVSEQFNLVSGFLSTPGDKGYLIVINVDDQPKAVSRSEVEGWVQKYNSFKK